MLAPLASPITAKTGMERFQEDQARELNIADFYVPYVKQQRFHASKARYRGLGGAAGPGKSLALIYDYLDFSYSFEIGSEIHCLLLRRTSPQLKGSMIQRFREKVDVSLYRKFNESQGNYEVHLWNGATISFGSMQHEKDVYNYQGSQWARIGYDEGTQFTLKQWVEIGPWNRCPIAPAKRDLATNPIGIGAGWVMSLFGCDGKGKRPAVQMDENQIRQYRPDDYEFIPCTFLDNPVYANDQQFLADLEALPERLRVALKLGLWSTALGSYFDIWDESIHVVPAGSIKLEPYWPKWVSEDYGFGHDGALYFHCLLPDGRVYTFAEVVASHKAPAAWADAVIAGSLIDGQYHKLDQFDLSFDSWNHKDDSHTIAEQIAQVLRDANKEAGAGKKYPYKFPEPQPATRDKMGSEMFLYSLMNSNNVIVSDACPRLIQCIPSAPRDEEKPEQIAYFDGNDPLDGYRYGIYGKMKGRIAPLEVRVQKRIQAAQADGRLQDPFAVAMAARKFEREEKKKGLQRFGGPVRVRPSNFRGGIPQ